MSKLFCKDCRYLISHTSLRVGPWWECWHPNNLAVTKGYYSWLKEKPSFKAEPNDRNKNNDCALYAPNLWARLRRLFRGPQ
jgi:hypothetical protein